MVNVLLFLYPYKPIGMYSTQNKLHRVKIIHIKAYCGGLNHFFCCTLRPQIPVENSLLFQLWTIVFYKASYST